MLEKMCKTRSDAEGLKQFHTSRKDSKAGKEDYDTQQDEQILKCIFRNKLFNDASQNCFQKSINYNFQ